jgi:hypothetical protein
MTEFIPFIKVFKIFVATTNRFKYSKHRDETALNTELWVEDAMRVLFYQPPYTYLLTQKITDLYRQFKKKNKAVLMK